jgi:uncharacterized membrane protein YccC
MNWSSLIPDLVVALFGAGLTVGIAGVTYFRQLRRRNAQLVRNLADDLSTRRALTPIEPRESSADSEDADRCFRSVAAAAHRISEARDQISPDTDLRQALQRMVVSCVQYKDAVESAPRRWQFALMRLREELLDGTHALERAARLPEHSLPTPGDGSR